MYHVYHLKILSVISCHHLLALRKTCMKPCSTCFFNTFSGFSFFHQKKKIDHLEKRGVKKKKKPMAGNKNKT